ncbi:MAG: GNAT family N-acetyltransferase [Candidatus Bathyarchaeota archaeon]|nr:MAG: GNAT family N-acetyltransferase [Candidatus Bathyarchaeota archaeon]
MLNSHVSFGYGNCGNDLLKMKRFVQGRDEADWVRVWNAAYEEYIDIRRITVDEFRIAEKAPAFDSEGRFIIEKDEKPVGIIHAHVDKLRKEKKGFIRSFGILPEYRNKGLENQLAETALRELKNRGMETVQAWARETRKDRIELWKSLGFKLVRKFSLMKTDLNRLPSDIDENEEVILKQLRKDSDQDLRILNWLGNECFKEHFNFRRGSIEETKHFLRKDPFFKVQDWYFAISKKKHVGYIGVGIDENYNQERKAKCGWILDIGVLKSHRRKDIGTKLMLQGLETLKVQGMTTAMLGVDDWNVTKAMKLYEKVGFYVEKKDLTYERSVV